MMKWTLIMATLALVAADAQAQTQRTGRGGNAAAHKSGAMTIKQASGGGVRHGPRTVKQPTIRPSHPSAGTAHRAYGAGTHATTSKGMSGIGKDAQRPASARH